MQSLLLSRSLLVRKEESTLHRLCQRQHPVTKDHSTTAPVALPVECTAKGKNLQLLKIEIMSHETSHKNSQLCHLQNHHRTITIVGCRLAQTHFIDENSKKIDKNHNNPEKLNHQFFTLTKRVKPFLTKSCNQAKLKMNSHVIYHKDYG